MLSVSHIKDKRVDAVMSCLLGVAKLAAEQGGLNVPEPVLEKLAIGVTRSAASSKRVEASGIRKIRKNKEHKEGLRRRRRRDATVIPFTAAAALQQDCAPAEPPSLLSLSDLAAAILGTDEGEPEEVTLANLILIAPNLPAASLERKPVGSKSVAL